MPPADPWIRRQNAALRLRGHGVSLEVVGSRVRLRATLPPRPGSPNTQGPSQQRLSTGLHYPDQATDAVRLAEALGLALERDRCGVEPFNWRPWLARKNGEPLTGSSDVSGDEALEIAREWWMSQKPRGRSAATTWRVSLGMALKPLRGIPVLQPEHLDALIGSTKPNSRTRQACGSGAVVVVQALGWPAELIPQLRLKAKGYSLARVSRRDLPSDDLIQSTIDAMPPHWQWPAGVVATYGCRPHEAMLYAEVESSSLLRIDGGKTGARRALAHPAQWIERWQLMDKRLLATNSDRTNREAGRSMTLMFSRLAVPFRPYDLRHAWAVRAIKEPRISPSLAAKSMGHSLTMHSSVYQRWFTGSELESIQDLLSGDS